MENWVMALIGVLLVIIGAFIGGLAVYVFGRLRRRQRHGPRSVKRSAANQCMGDFETQMTAAEKQVLRDIASADGAISLTLKLPDPRLRLSITHSSLPYAGHSSSATLPPTEPSESKVLLAASQKDHQDTHGSSDTPPIAAADARCADRPHSRRGSTADPSGAGGASPLLLPRPSAEVPARSSTSVSESGVCYTRNGALFAARPATPTAQRPAAFALSEAAESDDAIEEIMDQPMDDADGPSVLCSPRLPLRHAQHPPRSLVERHIEAARYANMPASPHTLASPCGSSDYEFVPPSPSISSVYEVKLDSALPQAPAASALLSPNPRSAGIGKSISSPGCLPASSLFSPPPVTFHQRYFETHGLRSPATRNSEDRTAEP
ncbi:hypothetical protein H4R26_001860 [Coemansia thaxteri]|uniref:Uncharacterized protein n=1 Tax=Coemansia thaxteri TaxID=2663907 RepID=A0A9W8EGI0_9FUNG|nr:hypothetical protein H4R26_001860 [Coemansia thaxteri]